MNRFILKQIFATENVSFCHHLLLIKALQKILGWRMGDGSSLLAYLGLLYEFEHKVNALLLKNDP